MFDQEKLDALIKFKDLLLEDEHLDNMLRSEAGSDEYILIALEFALPILKEHLQTSEK